MERALVFVMAYTNGLVGALFNIAIPLLPILPAQLGVSPSNAAWVATVFFLAGAAAFPVMGRLADVFGLRRMLIACLVLLIAGSTLCALSPSLPFLLAGRALQGIALPISSIALSVLRDQVPAVRLPAATASASAALGVGNVVGLIGGGFLLDRFSWQSVFWLAVGMSAIALAGVLLTVPRSARRRRQPLDLPGIAGLTAILVCVLLPLSKLAEWGASWATFGPLLAGAALLPLWIRGRRRTASPVIDLRSLARPALLSIHLGAATAGYAGFTAFIFTSTVLQDRGPQGFGVSLTVAGFCIAPASLAYLFASPLAAVSLRRLGLRTTLLLAGAVAILAALGMAVIPLTIPLLTVLLMAAFCANAMFLAVLPIGTAEYSDAAAIGSTNGVNAMFRTIGLALASGAYALISTALESNVRDMLLWGQGVVVVLTAAYLLHAWRALPARDSFTAR